jgi:hypothetical protein
VVPAGALPVPVPDKLYKPIAELIDPRSLMLDFSTYESGIDFKCPYSSRPLKSLNRLNAIFVLAVDRIAKSPYLFNWSMSSAIGL